MDYKEPGFRVRRYLGFSVSESEEESVARTIAGLLSGRCSRTDFGADVMQSLNAGDGQRFRTILPEI